MKNPWKLSWCVWLLTCALQTGSARSHSPVPTAAGQAGFAAISKIVQILKSDATTDWAKVNIEALRQHLIDMDAVVMRAVVRQKDNAAGFYAEVTGTGTTIASIQRLATNHIAMLNSSPEYTATAESVPTGVRVRVSVRDSADTKAVARLRALGFVGLLTEGGHHQPHHLAIARGVMIHKH